MDDIRKIVLPDSNQSRADRDIAYRCMHLTVENLIHANVGRVFLVATYSRKEPREWLGSLAEKAASDVYVIACKVSPDVAVARFRCRKPGHAAVNLDEDRVRREAAEYVYTGATVVDTETTIEANVVQAERYVCTGEPVDVQSWASHGSPR